MKVKKKHIKLTNDNQMKAIVHKLVPGITIKVIRYTVVYSVLYMCYCVKQNSHSVMFMHNNYTLKLHSLSDFLQNHVSNIETRNKS